MSNPVSPLQAIHHKETVLQRRLEAARQQTEASLQAVHEEAQRRVAQADKEGQAEAKALFEQGLEAARQEAEAILTTAQVEAATLHNRVAPRLNEAAQQILKLVLPENFSLTNNDPVKGPGFSLFQEHN